MKTFAAVVALSALSACGGSTLADAGDPFDSGTGPTGKLAVGQPCGDGGVNDAEPTRCEGSPGVHGCALCMQLQEGAPMTCQYACRPGFTGVGDCPTGQTCMTTRPNNTDLISSGCDSEQASGYCQ